MASRASARYSGLVCLAGRCCLVVLLAAFGTPFVVFVVGSPPLITLVVVPFSSAVLPLKFIPPPLGVDGSVVLLLAVVRGPANSCCILAFSFL